MRNIPKSGDYTSSFNAFVFDQVPEKSVCLDVGCWTGSLGRKLIESKKCIVDGIDVQPEILKTAKKNGYRNTYRINFNNESYSFSHITGKYDVIIFADILEHLIDPAVALRDFKKLLKPNGRIIVSLPNVGFILNRLNLLFGRWEYRDFGCMDKTHLRFFTIKSIAKLIESAGYTVINVKPYNQFRILRNLNIINNIYPPLFAYQTLITAKINNKIKE